MQFARPLSSTLLVHLCFAWPVLPIKHRVLPKPASLLLQTRYNHSLPDPADPISLRRICTSPITTLMLSVVFPIAGQVRPEPAGPPGVRISAKPSPQQDPQHQRSVTRGAGLLHKLLAHPRGGKALPPAQADRIRPAPDVRGRRRNLGWTGRRLLWA